MPLWLSKKPLIHQSNQMNQIFNARIQFQENSKVQRESGIARQYKFKYTPHVCQKIRKYSYDAIIAFLSSICLIQAPPPQYQSRLPNFLLSYIDSIIKIDSACVLRSNNLHHPIHNLLSNEAEPLENIWIFVDPIGSMNILSKRPHNTFKFVSKPFLKPEELPIYTEEQKTELHFTGHSVLSRLLSKEQMKILSHQQSPSIDCIRARCQANTYFQAEQLLQDLRTLLAWNQFYRADSQQSFEYLSLLYEQIIQLTVRKQLPRKFFDIKSRDFGELFKNEISFKTNAPAWPVIPNNFRQYEEVSQYIPSPENRKEIIMERLKSNKVPIECPADCVCLNEDQCFTYTLLNGWETTCPNRVRKIECFHEDPQIMKRCRNAEITKQERKRCKRVEEGDKEGEIQEFLAWGIDSYTRNMIFHSLPEIDVKGAQKEDNLDAKSYFIEKIFLRALNFLGTEGYSFEATCRFIIEHSYESILQPSKDFSWSSKRTYQEQKGEWLFTEKDAFYARVLLQNYQLCTDKTAFRIHTKGKGAKCVEKEGIKQGRFIIQYFGEIYEPWRWYDREDFIKEIMKKKKFKNYIPEFYNILLEKHPDQPLGVDMLIVDPSRMGNFSSRFSHSCNPNCGTVITASQGKYYIGMYSFRDIQYGQELTFDYCCTTESKYEHENSICLCGMRICRGKYLQLQNPRNFTNMKDNSFYERNSIILNSVAAITQADIAICARHNIKKGFLNETPNWITKWIAQNLMNIEKEAQVHKNELKKQWEASCHWDFKESEHEKMMRIDLYAEANRQDLIVARSHNLLTSVDKIKYFLSKSPQPEPPIFIEKHERIFHVLVGADDSIIKEIQQCLINFGCEAEARLVELFIWVIAQKQLLSEKLFIFRLCCLVLSQKLLFVDPNTAHFSSGLLSDILYFYAFTHTFFSPKEYKNFESEEIIVAISEITGQKSINDKKEKQKKRYSTPFVWGQMISWFKQTIVNPEASLSQDRRGTLSLPMIKSVLTSDYPYDKKTRAHFHKTVSEKPAGSWPTARGCELSFKNPYKLYGSMMFESVHSCDKLFNLPKETLLESCFHLINQPLFEKIKLFKLVEFNLQGIPQDSPLYDVIEKVGLNLHEMIPKRFKHELIEGEPRKRVKRCQE